MVAVSVILTRYQSGVRSVTNEEVNQRELTDNWLKRIYTKTIKGNSNDVTEAAEYQQVLESAVEEKESSDEGGYHGSIVYIIF